MPSSLLRRSCVSGAPSCFGILLGGAGSAIETMAAMRASCSLSSHLPGANAPAVNAPAVEKKPSRWSRSRTHQLIEMRAVEVEPSEPEPEPFRPASMSQEEVEQQEELVEPRRRQQPAPQRQHGVVAGLRRADHGAGADGVERVPPLQQDGRLEIFLFSFASQCIRTRSSLWALATRIQEAPSLHPAQGGDARPV